MHTLYQAMRDTGDPDQVEMNGPIKCTSSDAWLGHGYYFWDSSEDLAHYWGEKHYHGSYIICSALSEFREEELLDLINNYDQLDEFSEACDLLMDKYPAIKDNLTVSYVIEYLKKSGAFIYKAIRACGINSFGWSQNKILFSRNRGYFMERRPAWQVCVIDKSFLFPDSFKIVYPLEYIDGYMV